MSDTLTEANAILAIFEPELTLERVNNRLWIVFRDRDRTTRRLARLNASGCTLQRYHDLGMGGTGAQAVAQLVRWARGDTRLPLSAWQWWCGRMVYLARERGPELLTALQASSYPDAAKTGCVLCGAAGCGDWWSLDGVVGPCCCWNEGCRQRGEAR